MYSLNGGSEQDLGMYIEPRCMEVCMNLEDFFICGPRHGLLRSQQFVMLVCQIENSRTFSYALLETELQAAKQLRHLCYDWSISDL